MDLAENKKIKALNHKKPKNEENTPEGYHSFCLTVVILERPGYIASMMSMSSQGLCLNRTNGKDNWVRLRTAHKRSVKTVQNLTLILILTLSLRITLSLTLKRETKERNLEKGKKKRQPSGFELPNSQTNSSACDNPTNRAKWQLVTNQLVSLPFIAQHVIDKKLVLSLTRLSFPLVRFRLNPAQS